MNTKKILIVEDETNLAVTLAQALHWASDGNYQVQICESGDDALEVMKTKSFDLVISDLRLPGISGLEMITNMRESDDVTRTILMTAYGNEEVEAEATALTDAYMTKPFDMPDMLRVVDHIMKTGETVEADNGEAPSTRRILIMEDDPGLRRIYNKALSKAGYEIDLATTIKDARDYLTQMDYDIFICDIHLGRERGTDLLMEVREELAEKGTQIIMVSAYGQYRTVTEEMGADFFMEKPISLGTLITLISRLVEQGEQQTP